MRIYYKKTVLVVLLLVCAVVAYGLYSAEQSTAMVAFLDVGQGDSIFVSLPGGNQILIDGGPTDAVREKLGRYMPFHDRTIELVVLTHPHSDHVRGINDVLDAYHVKEILLTGVTHESRTYQEFFTERLVNEGARVYTAQAGDTIWVGEVPLAQVLSPSSSLLGATSGDVNQTSVVLDMRVGEMRFLLTGDVEEGIERELLAAGLVHDVDVLKVGHQGSRNATSRAFLASARPEVAVISVGQNSYGHPADEVIARLKEAGAVVLRTDEEGDIVWRFE